MNRDKPTVMVVDDEAELLGIFATWLERSGYRVLTAPNGAEALKVLASERVDALISDIRMPVMDGTTLVRRMHEMGMAIPSIIFVSGFGPADPREMHALGVEAMLEKPLSRMDLLRALEESLMEREKLWLAPISGPIPQKVSIDMKDLDDKTRTRQFQLGRGGCCFPCDQPLVEHQTIDLTVRLAQDGLCLKAQGEVRWYSADCALAGLAFRYLDPGCRVWVVDLMKAGMPSSFIPRGSKRVERADGSESQSLPEFVLLTVT